MARIDKLLQDKSEPLKGLCMLHNVRVLKLFGSATRDDFSLATSDLDFLVQFGDPPEGMSLATQYFGLLEDLEHLFGRHVDLLEELAIENSRLRRNALESSVILYAA